ncbi:MAG: small, acid-soluble spore protein L [Anaerobacillus sp.]|jgi:small acid-soluble spore protein L|uniref:small, acid-soluble spore protein L n=1 Tax=unclassified Anaerobacillus TaxID=2625356 RepID=UPI0021B7B59D|nr:small, acid-soluble spore protein L [Anaerobacillus sp. CMMVII]MCT8136819.1 small, acid-soluble spore protein L [Anaerobacillus sp. CMMVII]
MARKPRPTKGNRDTAIPGEPSVNPMGVSPDHEFSTEPLSKGALKAKKSNTKI